MNIDVELYASEFGRNNVTESFKNKKMGIKLTLAQTPRDNAEYILSIEEAKELVVGINEAIIANNNMFKS